MPAALHQMEKLQMSCSVGLNNAWLCNTVAELSVDGCNKKEKEKCFEDLAHKNTLQMLDTALNPVYMITDVKSTLKWSHLASKCILCKIIFMLSCSTEVQKMCSLHVNGVISHTQDFLWSADTKRNNIMSTNNQQREEERWEEWRAEDKIREEEDHRRRYITHVTSSGPDENSSADSMTIYG